MNIYILFGILLCIYWFLSSQPIPENKKKKILIKSFSIFLILESGLRNIAVGSDTYQFYRTFEEIKSCSLSDLLGSLLHPTIFEYIKDPFFWVFQKIFQSVLPHFRFLLLFVAILFFTVLGRFLYQNINTAKKVFLAYVFYLGMFYGFFSITATRQTIALSFVMIAFEFIHNRSLGMSRRFLFGIIFTFIGSLFHSSAILFLISFVILLVKNARKVVVLFTCTLIPLTYIFKNQLGALFVYSTGMEGRYEIYLLSEDASFSIAIAVLYFSVMVGILIFRKYLTQNECLSKHVLMYCITMCLLPTMYISASAVRITFYFSFSMYVLVPEIVDHIKLKLRYELCTIIMLILIGFSVRRMPTYHFFWQSMKVPEEYGSFYIQEHTLFD